MLFYNVLLFIILGFNTMNTSGYFVGLLYVAIIVMSYLLIKNQNNGLSWGRGLWWGLGLGFAAISAIFIVEYAMGLIVINGLSDIAIDILLLTLGFQVIVSLGEELAFRGYILKNMAAEMRPLWAVISSSILFSVIHIPSIFYYHVSITNGGIIVITMMLFSVLASLLYLRFGLLSAVGMHFSWNSMQYNIFSLQPRFTGLLDVDYTSASIISGGSFGPEAGLLIWVVLLIGIVALLNPNYSYLRDV
jgi:membrane protease YdiL (CAAX protease family)